ncbi:hypothetical protein B4O97_18900 [Marispirochaeta aestuarii]|uniref:Teneurin-like YD-shell domain-containing protein n=1 Tax=Marispirochaeta aestuarii TaxID=1963862 RepID=A0A1Y1RSU0_9SPIO|nr:RHS repeat-associated core domain-containing protein [Marispirochaeta aestuarii]ORC29592.1 hypothetical protein B4O97_18900 [Marispirochaeta aestuarii]
MILGTTEKRFTDVYGVGHNRDIEKRISHLFSFCYTVSNMKSLVPAHTRQQSAYRLPAHTCTISGAPLPCPIPISGSITSLICDRNDRESYDANGNVTRESTLPEGQSSAHEAPNLSTIGEVRRADQAFGFINEVESGNENEYIRSFSWDAENRLKSVLTSNGKSVKYLYDADGKRTTKYAGDGSYTEGISGETLYLNEWWTETADSGSFRRAKHIYVGKERIVTRLSNPSTGGTPYEDVNTYYYHPDHLGSAHCITDPQGNPYERIEYTPYGEMWIEIQEDEATASYNYIPFRFTAKEYDEETGLYYYGARYMDPKTSRWMSGDPAGYQLMNPMGQDGKPRQGYSIVEATNWYSYVSNNPVKYVDPTGMEGVREELEDPFMTDRIFEEQFEEYRQDVYSQVRKRTPEEDDQFYNDVQPALILYSEGQMDELLSELIGLEQDVANKRLEVMDLVNEYYHSNKRVNGLVEEGIITPLIPGPTDKAGYEVINFIIPEYIDELTNVYSLPRRIDIAINEYNSLFQTRDFVKKEHISQCKLRQQIRQ